MRNDQNESVVVKVEKDDSNTTIKKNLKKKSDEGISSLASGSDTESLAAKKVKVLSTTFKLALKF